MEICYNNDEYITKLAKDIVSGNLKSVDFHYGRCSGKSYSQTQFFCKLLDKLIELSGEKWKTN